jgi:Uma2 family endonuclease
MSATVTPPPRPKVTPSVGPSPWKWTRDEYYRLGELGFFNGRRVELIFGEIIEMSPIGWFHRVGCRKTAEFLERAFHGVAWIDRAEPINLTDSAPQPDVSVMLGKFEDYVAHPTTALLVVEVSDATLDFDLTTKAEVYATATIPEYWVLDVNARRLHVFRAPVPLPAGLGATAYRTHDVIEATGTVSPLAAPNAVVAVADLLP